VAEMVRFYGRPADELLDLPISRFWEMHKEMNILKLQETLEGIQIVSVPHSRDPSQLVYKLNWRLEQLTGKEKVDDLSDWRAKYGGKKKKKKKKKHKNELLFRTFKL
jgi:hypothetical protein